MSDEHVDAAADLISADAAAFASLPLPLELRILVALPPDARGRACCVCRAWRDALADPPLWTRLTMSGVDVGWQRFFAVLRCAAGRAQGQLRHLDLTQHFVTLDALLPVLTANAGSLRELHLESILPRHAALDVVLPSVVGVVAAAPLLQVLIAEDTYCDWQDAPRLLRLEPPFALLQMRNLLLNFAPRDPFDGAGGMEQVGPSAAALADAALQPALLKLCVEHADTAQPAVMNALVDAALARRLRELKLDRCTRPAAAPLARLLTEGALTVCEFGMPHLGDLITMPLFDAAGAALVADALRVNTTLTKLDLRHALLCADVRVAGSILGALVGHPSLRELSIVHEHPAAEDCSAFGAALAALIAADAPALHVLDCSCNSLHDAGLAPIVEALAVNRHLRELDCHNNRMSEAFALERLQPTLRANTTLRSLSCAYNLRPETAAVEAEELVRRRGQHG